MREVYVLVVSEVTSALCIIPFKITTGPIYPHNLVPYSQASKLELASPRGAGMATYCMERERNIYYKLLCTRLPFSIV